MSEYEYNIYRPNFVPKGYKIYLNSKFWWNRQCHEVPSPPPPKKKYVWRHQQAVQNQEATSSGKWLYIRYRTKVNIFWSREAIVKVTKFKKEEEEVVVVGGGVVVVINYSNFSYTCFQRVLVTKRFREFVFLPSSSHDTLNQNIFV